MGKPLFYEDNFQELWRAYQAPTVSSKKIAYESYLRAGKTGVLPEHGILLQAVEAYKRWLIQNSKPGREHPKAHLSTWINQQRWEGFLEEAATATAKEQVQNADADSWPPDILAALNLPQPVIASWFLPTKFIPGTPPTIECRARFHANWLNERFRRNIERVLGPGVIITYRV